MFRLLSTCVSASLQSVFTPPFNPCQSSSFTSAFLNLSLHESNKVIIRNAGAVKLLVYALKTGTETLKQNAACALMSLALLEENKTSIGVCGAIPPLVSLLLNGSNRGKKTRSRRSISFARSNQIRSGASLLEL
ncbi:U-box domain-containing protein 4 [Cucumis melo var. makuwa]|uniref:U-box domain-containing protein 4 n=1 Tax=Cucumis melo var. makuwa TaxID=1194695 RepID=A0A5D3DAI4_CUCMM|nr:U-box domain-containing protein 4 [Cucumis melo var. makuwa]TYK20480.1 U-box domain-containing protein 4 [Cucumis melo var. makuwa]